jgi:hypothetical protein
MVCLVIVFFFVANNHYILLDPLQTPAPQPRIEILLLMSHVAKINPRSHPSGPNSMLVQLALGIKVEKERGELICHQRWLTGVDNARLSISQPESLMFRKLLNFVAEFSRRLFLLFFFCGEIILANKSFLIRIAIKKEEDEEKKKREKHFFS